MEGSMKILVIGGTGHVGEFLVPILVKNGHEVYVGTRGTTKPQSNDNFDGAKFITVDATDVDSLRGLKEYGFDTIVEFPGKVYNVWQALKDSVSHIVACGSLWMFGYPKVIPTPEIAQNEVLFSGYNRRFGEMQIMLEESGKYKAVFSAVMPPNICGPGKTPIDQFGGRSIEAHKTMKSGETVYLPTGAEALIGPCDAEDLARLFALVVENREKAQGEIFNGGASYSLTATEFIKAYAKIYGVEIPIEYVSWERFTTEISPDLGGYWHFYAHMLPDISKARNLLGYEPLYTPEETMTRAVRWMEEKNLI